MGLASIAAGFFNNSLGSIIFGSFFFNFLRNGFALILRWTVIDLPSGGFVLGTSFKFADCFNLVLLDLFLSLLG